MAIRGNDLAPEMILHSDIVTKDETLILAAEHPINDTALEKIRNFEFVSGIKEPIFVQVPETVS